MCSVGPINFFIAAYEFGNIAIFSPNYLIHKSCLFHVVESDFFISLTNHFRFPPISIHTNDDSGT